MKKLVLSFINQIRTRLKATSLTKSISVRPIARAPVITSLDSRSNQSVMSNLQELENKRSALEAKVYELVEKLECKKRTGEIKLTKEQIIKSKEDREASAALEKLAIADKEASSEKTEQKPTDSKKKPPKQKGGPAAAKELDKPIDISRLDLRVGRIIEVARHPDADALYVEKIDCGEPSGPRTVISGLVKHVPIEDMKHRLVVVLCNLKPVKMRGILSEAMVMCASGEDKVEILGVPQDLKPGDRLVFTNYPGEPDALLNPKKKIWEQVSPDIKTNDEGVAIYKDCEFRVEGNDGKFKSSLTNVQVR